MKKPVYTIVTLILAITLIVFTDCRKKQDMTAIIIVKMMADTNTVVPNAKVVMEKGDLEVVGYTNPNGTFQHTFKHPVLLDVLATKTIDSNGTAMELEGRTILRLGDPGETYRKSVFVY